jgi:hypothetical protein
VELKPSRAPLTVDGGAARGRCSHEFFDSSVILKTKKGSAMEKIQAAAPGSDGTPDGLAMDVHRKIGL